MSSNLFNSEPWEPALDRFAKVTGLTVELFDADGKSVREPTAYTALAALFHQYKFDPGLFAECARRCLLQNDIRPAVTVAEARGLAVVGTSLMLEGRIVGAAIAGYAFAGFSGIAAMQRWARSAALPFDALWGIARQQAPVPERRLLLLGELLQVLGDALLRENHRTRQYEDAVAELEAVAAARDEFLAVVSHELRSPLAPILGWAGVLKKDQSPGQVVRAAEAIERNVLLQSRMVDDLLELNLSSRGKIRLDPGIVDLAACVRSTLEIGAPDIEKKGLRLEFVDAGEPLFIEADSGRLQQIFGNILSNAVKFTPDGGAVHVQTSAEDGRATVVVADTGVGIAPAFLPFVFDFFRQQESGTQRGYQGLGIGLALVKKLAELQKGSVTVASAGVGAGTQVTVQFPLVPLPERPEPMASAVQAPPSPSPLAGVSVLVVDDIEDVRETMRALLHNLGAKVCVAADGSQGLEMVRHARPDLVLCDLRMPRMDGFEFILELHRSSGSAEPPVIALTALASGGDRERTRQAGFHGHVSKPCDAAAIVAAVNAALHRPTSAIRAASPVSGEQS